MKKTILIFLSICSIAVFTACSGIGTEVEGNAPTQTTATTISVETVPETSSSETSDVPEEDEYSPTEFCGLFKGLWISDDGTSFMNIDVIDGTPSIMFGVLSAGGFPYSEISAVEELDADAFKINFRYIDEITGVLCDGECILKNLGGTVELTMDGKTMSYQFSPNSEGLPEATNGSTAESVSTAEKVETAESISEAKKVLTFGDAADILGQIPEVTEYYDMGMAMMCDGTTEMINSENCLCMALGTNSAEKFTREIYYAVSPSGTVYRYDMVMDNWEKIN